MFVALWNTAKSLWSRANDAIMRGANRRPVPTFATPEAAAAYLMKRAVYTGDPGGGILDFNLHPERLQWAMDTGPDAFKGLAVDCDDYATWAWVALRSVPECQPIIYTLLDAGLVGSHVVCAYKWRTRYGVIDTNGHRFLPNIEPGTLCRVFSDLYAARGYHYVSAEPTAYPF
jgi:hypothetical protein